MQDGRGSDFESRLSFQLNQRTWKYNKTENMAGQPQLPSFQVEDHDDPESYANEVINCLLQMREQRQRLEIEIESIQSEKERVQLDIRGLTGKLAKLNYRLGQKTDLGRELEKTIAETETAYSKLLESSQILFKSVKHTQVQLNEHNDRVENEKYPKISTTKK